MPSFLTSSYRKKKIVIIDKDVSVPKIHHKTFEDALNGINLQRNTTFDEDCNTHKQNMLRRNKSKSLDVTGNLIRRNQERSSDKSKIVIDNEISRSLSKKRDKILNLTNVQRAKRELSNVVEVDQNELKFFRKNLKHVASKKNNRKNSKERCSALPHREYQSNVEPLKISPSNKSTKNVSRPKAPFSLVSINVKRYSQINVKKL